MSEILTESFCERCGTRYTFESGAPRSARLKGIKVLSRGLKNFVMSDDTSMDEAMAAARNDTDREVTTQQLDAFHKTFNFCMNCRQYTCGNCWNEAANECLTCSPNLGQDVLPAPFPDLDPATGFAMSDGTNGTPHAHLDAPAPMAWPSSDLVREETAPVASFEPGATLEDILAEHARPEDTATVDDLTGFDDLEPVDLSARLSAATEVPETSVPSALDGALPEELERPTPIAAPPDADARAVTGAEQTVDLLRRFRPGQSLDDEIAAFEREQELEAASTSTPATAAPEPVVAPEPEPEPIAAAHEPVMAPEPIVAAAPEPEPIAVSEPEPEPVPFAAAQEPVPAIEPEPEPAPLAAAPEPEPDSRRDDLIEQPTWRIIAPDPGAGQPVPPPPAPAQIPVEPAAATAEPQWPVQPEWPSQRPSAEGLPFLGRPATVTGGIEALWAESAREVAEGPVAAARASGVQPCVSCGLSLSSTARFCRRCGTPQA